MVYFELLCLPCEKNAKLHDNIQQVELSYHVTPIKNCILIDMIHQSIFYSIIHKLLLFESCGFPS